MSLGFRIPVPQPLIWKSTIVCSKYNLSFRHEMNHFSARGLIKLNKHYDVEGLPSLLVLHLNSSIYMLNKNALHHVHFLSIF